MKFIKCILFIGNSLIAIFIGSFGLGVLFNSFGKTDMAGIFGVIVIVTGVLWLPFCFIYGMCVDPTTQWLQKKQDIYEAKRKRVKKNVRP